MAPTSTGDASHTTEATNGTSNGTHRTAFKYAAFKSPGGSSRIGSLDIENGKITPLVYGSGTHIQSLYEVIESSSAAITTAGDALLVADVELLPPISGRDILAVGKNYAVSQKAPTFGLFAHYDNRNTPKSSTPLGRPSTHHVRVYD